MKPLAGIAAFLRQLSLFDTPESAPPSAAPPSQPKGTGAGTADFPPAPGSSELSRAGAGALPPAEGFAPLLKGPFARIEVVPKPRLRESWRLSWIRKREGLRLEIPLPLAEAPPEIKRALLEWALLVSRRGRRGRFGPGGPGEAPGKSERTRRAELERSIRQALLMPAGSRAQELRSARDARRLSRLRTQGEYYDLAAVLAAVNARYFGGALEARITWSARLGGLSTHTLARDGEGRPYHLLTISRGYDDPEATPEILGGVVYHECLHIAIPPRLEGGRRVVHGPDFRKREHEYAHFEAWRKWHREGLPASLRRLRRRRGRGKDPQNQRDQGSGGTD